MVRDGWVRRKWLSLAAVFLCMGAESLAARWQDWLRETRPKLHTSMADLEKRRLSWHPFQAWKSLRLQSSASPLGKLSHPQASLQKELEQYLQATIAHPLLRIHTHELTPARLSLTETPAPLEDKRESLLFTFAIDDIPFCELELKAHKGQDGMIAFLGSVPPALEEVEKVAASDWPPWTEVMPLIHEQLSAQGLPAEEAKVIHHKPCYGVSQKRLLPLWEVVVRSAGLSFRGLANDEQLWRWQALYFDLQLDKVEGKVQAYERNPIDSGLKVFAASLTGEATLTSEFFETDTSSLAESVVARAKSSSHQFIYEPEDERFAEASVFIHATNMHSYFQSLGYQWEGPKPLLLNVHALLNNNPNNALYEPDIASPSRQATISIGDGDGQGLANLAFDADVVSHEFGHHVVYRTLKNTIGESLVLHEGLADYFAFARFGDSCLGESICPKNSLMCMIKGSCLRTASLDLIYNSSDYVKMGAHLKGQLISSLLWGLRDQIGASEVTAIVFSALNYLVQDSGFQDFLVALLLADKDLYQASHACTLVAAASAKGLGEFLSDVDCLNQQSWVKPVYDPLNKAPSLVTKDTDQKEEGSDGFGCGVLALPSKISDEQKSLWFGLMLALPLVSLLVLF